jgi:hypothetical protein
MDPERDRWIPFENGETVGQRGSEDGLILLDDEYPGCARITLERDAVSSPFAITCGVYGWIVHTHFLSSENESRKAFDAMKLEINRIVDLIPDQATFDRLHKTDRSNFDHVCKAVAEQIKGLVGRFQ